MPGRRISMLVALALLGASCARVGRDDNGVNRDRSRYPAHWWATVAKEDAQSWEILPQEAGPGEVILSKRHELGLLSNFAPTPFYFRGRYYASLEGFWQMMRYPEGPDDPRAKAPGAQWPHTRDEVTRMVGFEALAAGGAASRIMQQLGITWVTFEGRRIDPSAPEKGEFYRLILDASWAKIRQNPQVREVLLSTGDLKLRPDHHQPPDAPPAWKYYEIYMEIRASLRKEAAGKIGVGRVD